MKIVLIGPVYPYKGGISHYTGLLCRALRKKHDETMISYKMQYPRILYKREQRDYANDSFAVKDTQYLIHTANPLNWIKIGNKIKKMNPDIIIIQWWHPYFAPCYFVLTGFLNKIKILFVCHNVFPHERFPLDKLLTKMVLRRAGYYVVQSHTDERDLLSVKKDAAYVVTPHPTYNAFKMQNLSKKEAREKLGMKPDVPMLLFFGFIREYKGLKYLLHAMTDICKEIPNLQLWVVGDFGDDRQEYINMIEKLEIKDHVTLVEGYIPDQEVEKYFAAADLVALPYISATQSGIVQIAYGFEKPVLVTDVGGLPDVVRNGETGYVVKREDAGALACAVKRFFRSDKDIDWQENIRRHSQEFSWETMTDRIETLIRSK